MSSVSDSCHASALRRIGGDVVPRAERPALRAQHHNAGGGVGIGGEEPLDERVLELEADRIQLVGAVDGHDADAAVHGVLHQVSSHGRLSAGPAAR
jgi:hypothetical protein